MFNANLQIYWLWEHLNNKAIWQKNIYTINRCSESSVRLPSRTYVSQINIKRIIAWKISTRLDFKFPFYTVHVYSKFEAHHIPPSLLCTPLSLLSFSLYLILPLQLILPSLSYPPSLSILPLPLYHILLVPLSYPPVSILFMPLYLILPPLFYPPSLIVSSRLCLFLPLYLVSRLYLILLSQSYPLVSTYHLILSTPSDHWQESWRWSLPFNMSF